MTARLGRTLFAGAAWGAVAGLALIAIELVATLASGEISLPLILGPSWPSLVLIYALFGLITGLGLALFLWVFRRPLAIAGALAAPHGVFVRLYIVCVPLYVFLVARNNNWRDPAMDPKTLVWDGIYILAAGLAVVFWLRKHESGAFRIIRAALLVPATLTVLSTAVPFFSMGFPEEDLPRLAAPRRSFNVLLVTVDTLRARQLGCYGYARDTSPAIDRLAREGVRLTDVRTVSTQTDPSHATMFTGLFPTHHGLLRNGWQFPERNVTLAETLRAARYQTFAAISVQHLSSYFGFVQGTETFRNTSPYDRFYLYSRWNHSSFSIPILSRSVAIERILDRRLVPSFRRGEHASNDFLSWLARYDGQAPFYAWVHLFDPHSPYDPPAGWAERFEQLPPALDQGFVWDEGARKRFDQYDGEVAYTDSQVGRMVNAIDARGLGKKTLIVILSDHGESLGERGSMGHNGKSYAEALQVPWIMRLPGYIPAGEVLDVPASTVDVMPTILALLGVSGPGPFDGLVLPIPVPELRDTVLTPRPILARTETWSDELHLAAVDGDFKSLESRRVSSGDIFAAPELYDLAKDPRELHDLARSEPDRLARVRETLAPMLIAVEGQGPVDEQTKGVLRALGYVQ